MEESFTYTDLARGDFEGKWDFSHSFRRDKLNIDKAEWTLKSNSGSRTKVEGHAHRCKGKRSDRTCRGQRRHAWVGAGHAGDM